MILRKHLVEADLLTSKVHPKWYCKKNIYIFKIKTKN